MVTASIKKLLDEHLPIIDGIFSKSEFLKPVEKQAYFKAISTYRKYGYVDKSTATEILGKLNNYVLYHGNCWRTICLTDLSQRVLRRCVFEDYLDYLSGVVTREHEDITRALTNLAVLAKGW